MRYEAFRASAKSVGQATRPVSADCEGMMGGRREAYREVEDTEEMEKKTDKGYRRRTQSASV